MPPLKNIRWENFCHEYLKDGHGDRAYVAAGFKAKQLKDKSSSASVLANHLLKNVLVINRMAELQEQKCRKYDVDRQWVIKRLRVNVGRALQAIPVIDKNGCRTGEYKYEGAVANKSLELLGKDIGMWPDKTLEAKSGDTYNLTMYNIQLPSKALTTDHQEPIHVNGHALPNGHTD